MPSGTNPPGLCTIRRLPRHQRTRVDVLSAVASSVTTVSAPAMLGELVAGNRDPAAMADQAGQDAPLDPELAEALTGRFDDHHALLVGAMLHRLDHVEAALVEVDAMIAAASALWARQIELLQNVVTAR